MYQNYLGNDIRLPVFINIIPTVERYRERMFPRFPVATSSAVFGVVYFMY